MQTNLFKLVHLSGKTKNKADLQDLDFGVVAKDSYRLKRKVEMYQWIETFNQGDKDNAAHYKYHKEWTETPIDSI